MTNAPKPTMGSLFDGIGGFILAASFFNIETLWASEILPDCISITKRHFPYVEYNVTRERLDRFALSSASARIEQAFRMY